MIGSTASKQQFKTLIPVNLGYKWTLIGPTSYLTRSLCSQVHSKSFPSRMLASPSEAIRHFLSQSLLEESKWRSDHKIAKSYLKKQLTVSMLIAINVHTRWVAPRCALLAGRRRFLIMVIVKIHVRVTCILKIMYARNVLQCAWLALVRHQLSAYLASHP